MANRYKQLDAFLKCMATIRSCHNRQQLPVVKKMVANYNRMFPDNTFIYELLKEAINIHSTDLV